MGLDMYLNAEYFVWDYGEAAKKAEALRVAIKNVIGVTPGEVKSIETEAGYWRKANAIHKWFVDNVQNGVDECQRSFVDRDQLKTLRDLCQEVIDNPESAKEKLPTESGFFFGDTSIDGYYFEDLKLTVEIIDNVLDEKKYPKEDWHFYYRSSW